MYLNKHTLYIILNLVVMEYTKGRYVMHWHVLETALQSMEEASKTKHLGVLAFPNKGVSILRQQLFNLIELSDFACDACISRRRFKCWNSDTLFRRAVKLLKFDSVCIYTQL